MLCDLMLFLASLYYDLCYDVVLCCSSYRIIPYLFPHGLLCLGVLSYVAVGHVLVCRGDPLCYDRPGCVRLFNIIEAPPQSPCKD